MAFKVFYAWQSDRPNNLCRGLIRRALDKAKDQLNDELEIDDALRDVKIDQDTQGVAGSPSIAETILAKIRNSDAFIPDLTFILGGEGMTAMPNPNVLIEYGYALHALGDQRIIGVFNDAFGTPDDLPFEKAGLTEPCCVAYNAAVVNSNIKPGDRVVVLGPGPIGILCGAMARLQGADVAVVGLERDRTRLAIAEQYGCTPIVDGLDAWVRHGDGLGVDGVIDSSLPKPIAAPFFAQHSQSAPAGLWFAALILALALRAWEKRRSTYTST